MATPPEVTIILPTTGERHELVRYSLDCIRRQTVREIEIFIVGDGVLPASREAYEAFAAEDSRVRFFDYPKHFRRAEPVRHELLTTHARGTIVAYCTDRDLWFPHHLEVLRDGLRSVDFAHTLAMHVRRDGRIVATKVIDLSRSDHRRRFVRRWSFPLGIQLSVVGHSLEAYRHLPEGWTVTPPGQYTDYVMWRKWLQEKQIRAATLPVPTLLYFSRGSHPGLPVEQRSEELRRWHPKTLDDAGYIECLEQFVRDQHGQRADGWDETSFLPNRLLLALMRRLRRTGRVAATVTARLRRVVSRAP